MAEPMNDADRLFVAITKHFDLSLARNDVEGRSWARSLPIEQIFADLGRFSQATTEEFLSSYDAIAEVESSSVPSLYLIC